MKVSLSLFSFNQQTGQKNKHLDMKHVLSSLSSAHLPTQTHIFGFHLTSSVFVYTVNNDQLDAYVHQTLITAHLLGQEVDSQGVFVCVGPQLDLSQNLSETQVFSFSVVSTSFPLRVTSCLQLTAPDW